MGSNVLPPGQPAPMGDKEFIGASVANIVKFKTADIDPPTSLYVQRDDQLLVVGISSNTPGLTISCRLWLAAEGRITTIQSTLNLPNALSPKNISIPLAEGYLLSVVVTDTGSTQQGTTFVICWINRGIPSNAPVAPGAVLIKDYLAGHGGVSWPTGRVSQIGDGPGNIVLQFISSPSAGADFTLAPGTQELWQVISLAAQLVTSAAVATRNIQLTIDDGSGNLAFISAANVAVTAGSTVNLSASSVNQTSTVVPTDLYAVLPPGHVITSPMRILSSTQNIQAGDQWQKINILLRKWVIF